MSLTTLFVFITMSAAIIAIPGPTVLLALQNGSRHGLRAAAWGMGGAVLADALLVTAVACGLGLLLAASEGLFQVLKWIGSAYLVWLGWQMLRAPQAALPTVGEGTDPGARSVGIFTRSFLVAISNPKALLFMSAFLPQFVDSTQPQLPQYACLLLALCVLNVMTMMFYAVCGARLLSRLRPAHLQHFNQGAGGLLMTMGVLLAAYRRDPVS
ncbi:LysE family translocator [Pseudomonas mucidolens]|uniref:Threonine/homoserine/homoserine lactone efflux protein n=1 Tax=Pseudomonas mucidolens TaxID=46679 RepID=A0A1H2MT12_9PSED|nr:LysE family translocator [Pseudomonas mucidolens]SDU96453.1 Threonine/homoserine/homoserine lactone efflux protein [Pseudomonas mucidolens]SQH33262.1 transporter, LysE family [Pseudomonas mucidolens]